MDKLWETSSSPKVNTGSKRKINSRKKKTPQTNQQTKKELTQNKQTKIITRPKTSWGLVNRKTSLLGWSMSRKLGYCQGKCHHVVLSLFPSSRNTGENCVTLIMYGCPLHSHNWHSYFIPAQMRIYPSVSSACFVTIQEATLWLPVFVQKPLWSHQTGGRCPLLQACTVSVCTGINKLSGVHYHFPVATFYYCLEILILVSKH